MPACNTEAMNLHLAEIATEVAPGAHAVLLIDQAGWHLSSRLVVPPNITLVALPPATARRLRSRGQVRAAGVVGGVGQNGEVALTIRRSIAQGAVSGRLTGRSGSGSTV